jgi:hypothetical protein
MEKSYTPGGVGSNGDQVWRELIYRGSIAVSFLSTPPRFA